MRQNPQFILTSLFLLAFMNTGLGTRPIRADVQSFEPQTEESYIDVSRTARLKWPRAMHLRLVPLPHLRGLLLVGKQQEKPFKVLVMRREGGSLAYSKKVQREWKQVLAQSSANGQAVEDLGCASQSLLQFQCQRIERKPAAEKSSVLMLKKTIWNSDLDRVLVQVESDLSDSSIRALAARFQLVTRNSIGGR